MPHPLPLRVASPPHLNQVHAWADGKDIYELLQSLDALGLSSGGADMGAGYEAEAAHMPALRRDACTTRADLTTAWHRVAKSLHPKRARSLPKQKRLVAATLYKLLQEAYEEEVDDDDDYTTV